MTISYPVKPCLTNVTPNKERAWGLFDSAGNWACHAPSGRLLFDTNHFELAVLVAGAINQAQADGKAAARQAMRDALGIEED